MRHFTPEAQPGAYLIARELWLDQQFPYEELNAAFESVDWDRYQGVDGEDPLDLARVTREVRMMEGRTLEELCCGDEYADIRRLARDYPEAHRCANFLFEVLFDEPDRSPRSTT